MTVKRATVFGGSGFIGRHIVRRLAADGYVVRAAVRDPERALFLKPMGAVGQVVPVYGDARYDKVVAAAIEGADLVFNAIGHWSNRRKNSFADIHVTGAERIASAAASAGVKSLVHISGIGVNKQGQTDYVRSRAFGEEKVLEAYPLAAIIRPSVVFGPGDNFFGTIGMLGRYMPVFPVVGPDSRIQPVYVDDAAAAAVAAAHRAGTIYEIAGPQTYTHRELLEAVFRECNRRRLLVNLPFGVAGLIAALGKPIPFFPLRPESVELLRGDCIASDDRPGLKELGIEPVALEAILPTAMEQYRRGGRWKQARLA